MDNIPTLNHGARGEIQNCNFDFKEEFYPQFHNFIRQNPGKTISELIKIITFYDFTEETLFSAFKLFNTYKNTFYNKCGPFLTKNDRWFIIEKNQSLQEQEIIALKQEIIALKKKLETNGTKSIETKSGTNR